MFVLLLLLLLVFFFQEQGTRRCRLNTTSGTKCVYDSALRYFPDPVCNSAYWTTLEPGGGGKDARDRRPRKKDDDDGAGRDQPKCKVGQRVRL